MGFFSKVFDAIDTGVKTVARSVEKVIEGKSVYEAVTSSYAEVKAEKRRQAEEKLREESRKAKEKVEETQKQNAEDFAEDFDGSCDVESASASEIRAMTDKFNKMSKSFNDEAIHLESQIIEFVQDSVKDMIKEFEEINSRKIGSSSLNLNISYLYSIQDSLTNKITGYIQNAVKRNLSIDDSRCVEILRIENKDEKKKAIKDLQSQIFKESVESLRDMINDMISVQNETIFNQITNRLNALEITAKDSLRQLQEIEKDKQLNENQLKKKQESIKNMIAISEWCITQLDKEVKV